MLKIKLARFGKRSQPHYRLVVNEQRSKRDGQYLDTVGTYAPTLPGKPLEINVEQYQAWLKKGAQPTPTVARLFVKFQTPKSAPVKKEPVVEKKEVAIDKKKVNSTKSKEDKN